MTISVGNSGEKSQVLASFFVGSLNIHTIFLSIRNISSAAACCFVLWSSVFTFAPRIIHHILLSSLPFRLQRSKTKVSDGAS